ncbi:MULTISPECIES: thiamine phosphate synthase [Blastomonas]|uniref:thiamine phosphate synthase n=1 Tax=Blastomonas TaxID=150203 RepID=UPI002584AE7E|nr:MULTISPECIES: thiamine phosphate synthase [Blastomonas]MDM7927443.1 thiamine phosphate synthase [Blastomonas fulva]MDM7964883.1 thiamine phosphate synthase [Blastomonas fulva]
MRRRQPGKSALPRIWLISDARNDAQLERSIARLSHGSGLVFRHYHLPPEARRARFDRLAKLIRRRGGVIVLAGDARMARRWRADGYYGAPGGGAANGLIRLLTVHDMRELAHAHAHASAADRAAALISPVFATLTHPGGMALGVARFASLARLSQLPVVALGGMTRRRSLQIAAITISWAAIDGLSA